MTARGLADRPTSAVARTAGLLALAGLALALIARGGPEPVATPGPPPSFRLDPNSAPPAVLAALPRLGPVKVAAIVDARESGPFDGPEDLMLRVRGIGPTTLEAIRPYLRFEHRD